MRYIFLFKKKIFYTIFLINITDSEGNEMLKKTWKEYMNINKNVLCLFVKFSEKISCRYKLDFVDNTLYIKGSENNTNQSYYKKFIRAFEFCNNFISYKYIIKTDLSTFWNFTYLISYLKLRQHGKYVLTEFDKPDTDNDKTFIIPNNLVTKLFKDKFNQI